MSTSTSGAMAWGLAALVAGACAVVGCSNVSAPGTDSQTAASQSTAAPAGQQTAVPADAPAAPAATTVADLLPAGAGREAVLNTCGSCHNLACSAIGQRPAARWDALKESHTDKVSGADLDAAFAYLKATFNDSKPEPKVPPQFLEGGCTPF